MNREQRIYHAVIANSNITFSTKEKVAIHNIVERNHYRLPSEIAHQICVNLEISLQENYTNLTEIISNAKY